MFNKIKSYRSELRLSQAALAEAIRETVATVDIGGSTIGNWEKGLRDPDLVSCRAVVHCFLRLGLEVTLDDVFPPNEQAERQTNDDYFTSFKKESNS